MSIAGAIAAGGAQNLPLDRSPDRRIFTTAPIAEADEKVFFADNSAALMADSKSVLDRQAVALRENPGMKAIVYGHADPSEAGSRHAAWDLGLSRALVVRDYLIARGVAAEQLRPDSRGADFLVLRNDSEAARAGMRFVSTEVIIREVLH